MIHVIFEYPLVRDDFERKMTLAAKHFQEVESAHLKQMREFIESYCQIVDNNNNLLGRVRFSKFYIDTSRYLYLYIHVCYTNEQSGRNHNCTFGFTSKLVYQK